jgi:hypothetical protein
MLTDTVLSKQLGIFPTPTGGTAYARLAPGCGAVSVGIESCHSTAAGGPTVSVAPSARVMTPGQKTTITVSSTGGVAKHFILGLVGGFAADVTAGTLSAGTGSQVNLGGSAITHNDSTTAQRKWSFGYAAPTTAGLVQFWAVVNTANGDGTNFGEQFAWHGSAHNNAFSTPVRLYVNGAGVQAVGTGCPDGNRNVGVWGAPAAPALGKIFKVEGFGLPPGQRCMAAFGFQKVFSPVSVANLGAGGCFLNTDLTLQLFFTTTGANTKQNRQLGAGTFSLSAPIPNQNTLKGLLLRSQLLVVDADSKNSFPIIFTNGLVMTVQ